MAEEALKCFTSLLDTVPGMLVELESVLKTSKENQKQMLSENQPADQPADQRADQLEDHPRKPSISSSLKSRPDKDEEPAQSTPQEAEQTAAREEVPHMTQADALRLAQRKRKTTSICSARQTGPVKYRSRSLVVVYYDGEVQKRFEALVRTIGVCRNSMRKGKMSAKLDIMVRTGSSGSEDSPDEGLNGIRKSSNCSNTTWPTSVLPKNDGALAFDKADGFLDKAQSLCERAAHQVLRDGDCALEVNSAKEHLVSAQKVSEAELPALRKKAEKAAEKRRISEERKEKMMVEKKDDTSIEKFDIDERLGSPDVDLEVDELEVDESEDDTGGEENVRPLVDTLQLSKFQVRSAGRRSYQVAAA